MPASTVDTKTLPENAYQPLKPGEFYLPIIAAEAKVPELTLRSVVWGVVFCVIFSIASAYSALKVGQGMEAAIPISILAIGLARIYQRRSSLLENMIITGIGGASAAVVSGAVFTVPALYSLHLDPHPVQTIFICLAGGCLGVLFLIPLRRYFRARNARQAALSRGHGDHRSPRHRREGRLASQAAAASHRHRGGVYDFFVTTFHVWKEYLNFQFVPVVRSLAERGRMVFNFDAVSFILGLGYVMGLRICHDLLRRRHSGELRACANDLVHRQPHGRRHSLSRCTMPISHMTAAEIYRNYVRFIGVGAIATAGLVGILKSLRVVAGSFGIALHAFRHGEAPHMERTDRDIPLISHPPRRGAWGDRSGRCFFGQSSCFLDCIGGGPGADASFLHSSSPRWRPTPLPPRQITRLAA